MASFSASRGELDDAVAQFRRAIALKPTLFDAQYHLGVTEFLRRDFEAALTPLRAAVAIQPRHAEAHYYLGVVLREQGHLDSAIEELTTATRLNRRWWWPSLGWASRSGSAGSQTPRLTC